MKSQAKSAGKARAGRGSHRKDSFPADQRRRAGEAYALAVWARGGKALTDSAVGILAERFRVTPYTIRKVGQAYIVSVLAERIEALLAETDFYALRDDMKKRGILWGYHPREKLPTATELRELADQLLHALVNPRNGPVVECGGLIAQRGFDGALELVIG